LEGIATQAIQRYVDSNDGNPHLLKTSKTASELSLDLTALGTGGRGKWRLLLTRENNTGPWKPHRIGDTHK